MAVPPQDKPVQSASATADDAAMRRKANRRSGLFILLFAVLMAGAVLLIIRKGSRGVVVHPEPPPSSPSAVPSGDDAIAPPPVVPQQPRPPASPTLRQSQRMEEALDIFREAQGYMVNKQFELAEQRARDALEVYPTMAAAQQMLGVIYIQQGRVNAAIRVLEESLRNEPFNAEAMSNLAFAYMQAGNMPLALELVETVRRLYPDYKPAIMQYGLMLLMHPDPHLAVEALTEAVAAFPDLPGPRNNLAVALVRAGDMDGARAQLERVLDMAPTDFSALFNMGALYARETNAPAAIPWLRKAMAQKSPMSFREHLMDADLNPIRDTLEFRQFLQELDPEIPGPRPAP